MSDYGRDADEILEDVAYAFGEGMNPIDYLGRRWERGDA